MNIVKVQAQFLRIILDDPALLIQCLKCFELFEWSTKVEWFRETLLSVCELERVAFEMRNILPSPLDKDTHAELVLLTEYLYTYIKLYSGRGILDEFARSTLYLRFKRMVEQELPEDRHRQFCKRYPSILKRLQSPLRAIHPEAQLYDIAGYEGLDVSAYLSAFLSQLHDTLKVNILHHSERGLPSLMEVFPSKATAFRKRSLPLHLEARVIAATTKAEAKKRYLEAYLVELLSTLFIPLSYPHAPKPLRIVESDKNYPSIDDMIEAVLSNQGDLS